MEVPGRGEAVEGSWGEMVMDASTSSPLPTARQPLDTQARCVHRRLGSLGDAQNAWRGAGLPSALQMEAPLGSAGQSGALWTRLQGGPCRDWHVSFSPVAPQAAAQQCQGRHLGLGGR